MKVNVERLDLLRSRLNLSKSEFADKIGVDRKTIQRFERGQADLSEKTIERVTLISGYPAEFLAKSTPEMPNLDGVSFRSLRSLAAKARDGALAAAALAFELDDWVHTRFDLPAHDVPQIVGRTPQEAAIALRVRWGIGVRPIANMLNVLESRGVRVFSLSEETRHLDAYAFRRNNKPYVFLNTCKTAEHAMFDAAHELGHLVLHRHSGSKHKSAEQEAHMFASEFLMPEADLIAHVPMVRSLKELIGAKRRWGVSTSALIYALRRLNRISEWNARGFYLELNRQGRDREPNPMPRETSQIWTKVLTALWRDSMTLSRLSTELCIPEKELNNLLFNIAAPTRTPSDNARPGLRLISN